MEIIGTLLFLSWMIMAAVIVVMSNRERVTGIKNYDWLLGAIVKDLEFQEGDKVLYGDVLARQWLVNGKPVLLAYDDYHLQTFPGFVTIWASQLENWNHDRLNELLWLILDKFRATLAADV